MFLLHFFFAFIIALFIAAALSALFGGRGVRRAGAWPIFAFLFVLLLLVTWAGGAWITPFGPVLWGAQWLPYLVVAVVSALLLAAFLPPNRPPRDRAEARKQVREEEAAGLALGLFFWIALVVLAVSIAARYL